MNADRHEQVKRIFLAACELDPGHVRAFLDAACAVDDALRHEVETLLAHHRDSTILERDPATGTDPTAHGERRSIANERVFDRSNGRREQLVPGTLVAERYRISQFLGAGGMGVVYRADDLWLGSPIAIKFLAFASDDPNAIESLRTEVRLARRVSHPYVTRMHDLGSANGDLFLTMEFVDGESLASLIERIGRLPEPKLQEVAWELLAGLQAIHMEGILHCDLKPENVLIDGRGRVRITDFGVAIVSRERQSHERRGGTPAFMAPELLMGQPATPQSDLFSLGMTLFCACTGEMPHRVRVGRHGPEGPGAPMEELLQSTVRDDSLREVIRRCLLAAPAGRPASALAALELLRGAALPRDAKLQGICPTAAEVATLPVPNLLGRRIRKLALTGCLLATVLALGLADRTMLLPRAGLPLAPNQLIARSQAVLESLSGQHAARDYTHGFALDNHALRYRSSTATNPVNESRLPLDSFAVYSWYRDGETFAAGPVPFGEPVLARDRALRPEVVAIQLTVDGRLREYLAASGGGDVRNGRLDQQTDWGASFRWAGLDFALMRSQKPRHQPPVYADEIAEWEGHYDGAATLPIRVEAAASHGEPVFFRVVFPWEEGTSPHSIADFTPKSANWKLCLKLALFVLFVACGVTFAMRNLRAGQADVPGARRVGAVTAALVVAEWLFAEAHVAEIGEEIIACYLWAAAAVLHGILVAIAYLAVEPALRGTQPRLLAGWTRLLQLRLRDGRVGDELLAGCLVGLGCLVILQLVTIAAESLGVGGVLPISPTAGPDTVTDLGELLGLRFFGGILVQSALRGVTLIWVALVAMMVLARLLSRRLAAQFALVIVFALIIRVTYANDASLPWMTSFVASLLLVTAIIRLGALAAMTGLFVLLLLTSAPLTLQWEHWFAATGWSAVIIVLALALAGYVLAERSTASVERHTLTE